MSLNSFFLVSCVIEPSRGAGCEYDPWSETCAITNPTLCLQSEHASGQHAKLCNCFQCVCVLRAHGAVFARVFKKVYIMIDTARWSSRFQQLLKAAFWVVNIIVKKNRHIQCCILRH